MYVGVVHTIRDADAWAEMMRTVDVDGFPAGLELLATGTAQGAAVRPPSTANSAPARPFASRRSTRR